MLAARIQGSAAVAVRQLAKDGQPHHLLDGLFLRSLRLFLHWSLGCKLRLLPMLHLNPAPDSKNRAARGHGLDMINGVQTRREKTVE